MITEILKNNNIKSTNQRRLIYALLENSKEGLTIKEIYNLLKLKVNIVTIYRIIDLFIKHDLILVKLNKNGEKVYSVINFDRGHYMKCVKCHKLIKIDFCPVCDLNNNNYEIVSHKLEIDIICPQCLMNI